MKWLQPKPRGFFQGCKKVAGAATTFFVIKNGWRYLAIINKYGEHSWQRFRNFIFHQKKGGIHAIYRFIMEAFGWYRLTGLTS